MAMSEAGIIEQILAPATMIPACGLLLLSSTARMNTVLARIRAFHHERLDVWRMQTSRGSRDEQVRELRLEGLEHQTHRLLERARLLRVTMLQLFCAVGCNVLAVIGLAAALLVENGSTLQTVSSAVFIAGVLLILGSMVSSFLEVLRILETVRYEHRRVERLCDTVPDDGTGGLSPSMGEGSGL